MGMIFTDVSFSCELLQSCTMVMVEEIVFRKRGDRILKGECCGGEARWRIG